MILFTSSREKFCRLPLKFDISLPIVSRRESPELDDLSRGGGGGCFDWVVEIRVDDGVLSMLCREKPDELVLDRGMDRDDGSNGDWLGRLLFAPGVGRGGRELLLLLLVMFEMELLVWLFETLDARLVEVDWVDCEDEVRELILVLPRLIGELLRLGERDWDGEDWRLTKGEGG